MNKEEFIIDILDEYGVIIKEEVEKDIENKISTDAGD